MEELNTRRGGARRRATNLIKKCDDEVAKDPRSVLALRELLKSVLSVQDELLKLDRSVYDELVRAHATEAQLGKEKDEQNEYQQRLNNIRKKVELALPMLSAKERQKKKRDYGRKIIENLCKKAEEELNKSPLNLNQLFALSELLQNEIKKDEALTSEIVDYMIADRDDEELTNAELELRTDFELRVNLIVKKLSSELKESSEASGPVNVSMSSGNSSSTSKRKRPFKLSEIVPTTFDGEISNWLEWWTEFRQVHEDLEYSDGDKLKWFQQTLVEGSTAYTFFMSHIRSKENYQNLVEAFKDRFGKQHLLENHYIRELQKHILTQFKTGELPLSAFTDRIRGSLSSLKNVGVEFAPMEKFMIPLIESAMPKKQMEKWQDWKQFNSNQHPDSRFKLSDLMDFLKKQVENETEMNMASSYALGGAEKASKASTSSTAMKSADKPVPDKRRKLEPPAPTAATLFGGGGNSSQTLCIFCGKSNHYSQDCKMAHELNYETRKKKTLDAKACFACLRTSPVHQSRDCKAKLKCYFCGQSHYPILCPKTNQSNKNQVKASGGGNGRNNRNNRQSGSRDRRKPDKDRRSENENGKEIEKSAACIATQKEAECTKSVLLSTCVVEVVGPSGSTRARLLMDSGSQFSYVGEKVANLVGCEKVGENMMKNLLFGGQWSRVEVVNIRKVTLQSLDGSVRRTWNLREKSVLCPGISRIPDMACLEELAKFGVSLSDHEEWVDHPEIELLIGQDFINEIVMDQTVRPLSNPSIRAEKTIFGWVINGPNPNVQDNPVAEMVSNLFVRTAEIAQLWDVERIGITDPLEKKSKEQEALEADKAFEEKVSRNEEGRVVVSLPWIGEKRSHLPSNIDQAKAILGRISNKLKNDRLFDLYQNEFIKWEADQIIERVPEEEWQNSSCHYLPHRPVVRPESQTTPIRPVFNASYKVGRNLCLNECLYPGPNLLEQIPTVLMRFREKAVGATSDIRKAFLMVKVHEEDRDALRFLWMDENGKLIIYRFAAVVFGVNCSPFLLAASLRWFLSQISDDRREVALKLLESFYVDNSATSFDNHDEYKRFKEVSIELLKEIKMDLCQWKCTEPEEKEKPCKVLGMIWDNKTDQLLLDCAKLQFTNPVTKRSVLSFLHSLFDPLGIVCPCTMSPKLLLQNSWKEETGWNDEFDSASSLKFLRWCKEIEALKELRIPRQLIFGPEPEVHCFCDASKNAYSAVVFIRSGESGKVNVQLAMAKSRLVPLKEITIPRLELMSCSP